MAEDASTIGDAMLEVFRAYGAEYIFSSPGSEWAPLWDALARATSEGKGPRFYNTRHEELAISLAVGSYRQARKLQVVLLHTTVGTLHGAMALRCAQHERVPMVVLAGCSAGYGKMAGPDPGYQWARVLADVSGPADVARPYVKRSSSVTCREVLLGMLQDACRLALTPPFGPVFLSVPLEFLFGDYPPFEGRCTPPPLPTHSDSSALEQVAKELVQAERPVLLTEFAGRDPRNVTLLVELAENLALPVVEARAPVFLNFPRDHALHQGFESGPLLDDADLVLMVGDQMPWYPEANGPRNARIILIDEDPARELLNHWAYGVDQVIGGSLTSSLQELVRHVKRLLAESGARCAQYDERRSHWQRRHEQQREEWRAAATSTAQQRPIDAQWAACAIGEAISPDAIVAEETITHKAPLLRYLKRNQAGTFHSTNTGGLGVGLGVALGLKLAAPERLVVAVEGDGSFNYNPVLAAFGFAQQFRVPILVILMNNQGYVAMKRSHLGYYPDGWAVRTDTFFGSEIEPTPDYVAIAQAFGGYGERVEDPQALPDALRAAIERVQRGQLALLDITGSSSSQFRR